MKPLTIIFSGMFAGDPWQGGATWAVLQYVLGLRELGHDVHVIEPISRPTIDDSVIRYFDHVREHFALATATLLRNDSSETIGLAYEELLDIAGTAQLLINISGMLRDSAILERIPKRLYVDLDPAFVQLWHATERIDMRFDAHTHFATVGQLIGTPQCTVPTCGREWMHVLPPVVLRHWPVAQANERDALTTIGNWRGYGSLEREGVHYGQKAHSFRKVMKLPRRVSKIAAVALSIHPDEKKDLEALKANGWELLDPSLVDTPLKYQAFIQQSWAEIGIAKSGYSMSNCGWFSDRSAAYLASGRPVIAQETGASQMIPVGEGLLTFRDVDDCAAAVEQVQQDYPRHARAARRLAEVYFDSNKVLPALLERVL